MTGELFAFLAAIAFGMSSVAIAKGARTASGESGVLLAAICTAALSGLGWAVSGSGVALHGGTLPWIAIGWFVSSGLLATVFGRITMFKSVEFSGVIRATTTRRLMPFISLFLGWTLLRETISPAEAAGMALIGASFLLLYQENRAAIRVSPADAGDLTRISRGLAFGVASATLYAISFVARKYGLSRVPDPFFGAFVGSLAAIGFYAISALVSARYRAFVVGALTVPNPWQLFAALLISLGQVSQFVAIKFTDVSRVAFINSIEVYIAAILAVAVFRTEAMPGRPVIIATILATAGVVVMAAAP